MKQILPLFPSCVTAIIVDKDVDKLKINNEKFEEVTWGSTKAGSDKRILEKYPKTKKILLDEFKKIALEDYKYNNDFIITTSWLTKTSKGQSGFLHCHKNSFYSGVYYFNDYTDKSSSITFQSPLQQFYDFELTPNEFNIQNSSLWEIYPRKNLLLLFPSYLQHFIKLNNDEMDRYSLSFNIVPIGSYGYGDSTYNTQWVDNT